MREVGHLPNLNVKLDVLCFNYKSDGDAKFQLASDKRNAVYRRIPRIKWDSGPSGRAENPDKWVFFENRLQSRFKFGCYYLQYVPAFEAFDHAYFEVLTLYRTWSDNR